MKESDKELLELAADAAGYKIVFPEGEPERIDKPANEPWNPLEDDGDALRLAVKLKLIVSFADAGGGEHVCSGQRLGPFSTEPLLVLHSDLAATRRAIVRAAAAIGEQMP